MTLPIRRVSRSTKAGVPYRLDESADLDVIFATLPTRATPEPAVWLGVVPSVGLYRNVYDALLSRGYALVNTPDQHQRVFELDLAIPHLRELTARTITVRSVDECQDALATVPLPVFVKGSLASRKEAGWKACVAETEAELTTLVGDLLRDEPASRGRVVLRELLPLRTERVAAKDFPIAREYRCFVYRGEILSYGFYWLYVTLFPALTPAEEQAMRAIVLEAARRLEVPFVSLDVAQKQDGSFVIRRAWRPTVLRPEHDAALAAVAAPGRAASHGAVARDPSRAANQSQRALRAQSRAAPPLVVRHTAGRAIVGRGSATRGRGSLDV